MLRDKIKTQVHKDDRGCLITCTLTIRKQVFLSQCNREDEREVQARMVAAIIDGVRRDLLDEPR